MYIVDYSYIHDITIVHGYFHGVYMPTIMTGGHHLVVGRMSPISTIEDKVLATL